MKNTIKQLAILLALILPISVHAVPPVFVSSDTNSVADPLSTDTITVNVPAGNIDDLLLATLAIDSSAEPVVDLGGDWILLDSQENANDVTLAVFYRIADGTEAASYTFRWFGGANQVAAGILRYSGVDTANPIFGFDFVNDNNSPYTAPNIGSVVDGKIVRVGSFNGNRTTINGPGGDERIELSAAGVSLGVHDQDDLLGGNTGTYGFTTNAGGNDDSVLATIVLNPQEDFVEIEMVSKTVSDSFPNEGDSISYTLTLTNNGTLDSTAVVSDTMPGLDSPVTVSGTAGGSCAGSLATPISCTTASIAAGDSVTVIITGTVSSALADEAITTNTASLTAASDTDTSNDSASADILTCAAGLLNNGVTVDSTFAFFTDSDPTNNIDNACAEVVGLDYGDAPTATYGSPSHGIDPDLFIGSVVPDADDNNQGSVDADGDDGDASGDDEDGVAFTSPGGGDHAELYATVSITNNTGSNATVCAWLDEWDASGSPSGTFTGADTSTCQTGTGSSFVFYWGDLEEASGFSYARFRVCSTASECDDPAEVASNGEVEDYRVNFDFTPTAVTIGSINIESVSVDRFLIDIGALQMTNEQLLALLRAWDPDAADNIVDSEDILDALKDYLDPDGDGLVAMLVWDTLEERGTIGFFVERKTANSDWVRINDEMLPGLITAPLGGEYRLVDPTAQSGSTYQYQLIEQEATGRTNTYGPFQVEMQ